MSDANDADSFIQDLLEEEAKNLRPGTPPTLGFPDLRNRDFSMASWTGITPPFQCECCSQCMHPYVLYPMTGACGCTICGECFHSNAASNSGPVFDCPVEGCDVKASFKKDHTRKNMAFLRAIACYNEMEESAGRLLKRAHADYVNEVAELKDKLNKMELQNRQEKQNHERIRLGMQEYIDGLLSLKVSGPVNGERGTCADGSGMVAVQCLRRRPQQSSSSSSNKSVESTSDRERRKESPPIRTGLFKLGILQKDRKPPPKKVTLPGNAGLQESADSTSEEEFTW